jgi:hypothetical protein
MNCKLTVIKRSFVTCIFNNKKKSLKYYTIIKNKIYLRLPGRAQTLFRLSLRVSSWRLISGSSSGICDKRSPFWGWIEKSRPPSRGTLTLAMLSTLTLPANRGLPCIDRTTSPCMGLRRITWGMFGLICPKERIRTNCQQSR